MQTPDARLLAAAAFGIGVAMIAYIFRKPLLSLYNTDPEVIQRGLMRMSIILPTYFLCGLMEVAASQLRGMGYSIMPMLVSLTGACAFRFFWVYTIFAADSRMEVLYYSYPISWSLTTLAHLACYFFGARRKMMAAEKALMKA